MKKIKVVLLGFGNAGQAFAKLLLEKKKEILETFGYEIAVVGITTKSRGGLADPSGIDLEKACRAISEKGRFEDSTKDFSRLSSMDVVEALDYDVMIELTPLEIFSGQPAIEHIKRAFARQKHVITANKGPIAWAYKELNDLAKKQGSLFYYETTVMDGTPIFNLVDETLKLCKVKKIEGILNSTTNYILEELAVGKKYEDILAEGKKRGFIEADPMIDIAGWDAAAKITALMNVLMHADLTPPDIDRTGIEGITALDLKKADERGNTIKLRCTGTIENGKAKGIVAPVEVPKGEILSCIDGTSSIVSITTDLMGKLSIVEHGPEIEQTGYGILSDLLRLLVELDKRAAITNITKR